MRLVRARARVYLILLAPLVVSVATAQESSQAQRRGELERLLRRLPDSPAFSRWLQESGELPPDFDALPSIPFLPDPLEFTQGGSKQRVTRELWTKRREQIARDVEKWLLGSAPPAPGNVTAEILEKTRDRGYEVWKVRLSFGPDHAAKLNAQLYLPKETSRPAPVFLCDSPNYIGWAEWAMANGFAFCSHTARDREDDSFAYAKLFGEYDWASFRRRGWSASRVVDWLITLPFVDKERIFIGGHSRSGKAAMAGAAFDERIAGVIASSPGSGGSMPYRYCDQSFFGESAELLTRRFADWIHPRVRFFCGRENKLPVDSHLIYALIAPRPVLMSTGTEDTVEGTWTIEQVFKAIQPVYALLGAPQNLAFRYRPGSHSTDAATARAYSEFLLAAAGRSGRPVAEHFPFTPYHVWDYEAWSKKYAPDVREFRKAVMSNPTLDANGKPLTTDAWSRRRAHIRDQVAWMLGDGLAYRQMQAKFGESSEPEALVKVLGRESVVAPHRTAVRFGDGIQGYLYLPDSAGKKPCVIWLAPFHAPRGFAASGYRTSTITPSALVAAGFVTLAFDPIGTGARQLERRDFYETHPRWSLMGKMVLDARHAIDAALASPEVDPKRVFLYGYAMGGMVATITAALDERVAGIASVAGFTPFRSDTDLRGTGGVRRYSHLYGWIPRLGPFVGSEERIPVDFHEILGAVAPRPALVVAPRLDRHATLTDVLEAVRYAQSAYQLLGAKDNLETRTPDDENRLTDPIQEDVIAWLQRRGGK